MAPFTKLLHYEALLAAVCLIGLTYVSKPSMHTLIISAMFVPYAAYVPEVTISDLMLLYQLFYLFANLRTPMHKLSILVLFIGFFVTPLFDSTKLFKSGTVMDQLCTRIP